LDSSSLLTRGGPAGMTAVLSHLYSNRGSYTAVAQSGQNRQRTVGQIQHSAGERSARLSFLLASDCFDCAAALLEDLSFQAGEWGAFHVLADLDEQNPFFETLRRVGFLTYARQRIWKMAAPPSPETDGHGAWRAASPTDSEAIRSLYQALVPPLVQGAEEIDLNPPHGLVYVQENRLLAYTEDLYGPNGIYLQPFIHPEVANVPRLFTLLHQQIPATLGRPVYVAVRSYQAWLESALEQLGAQPMPSQVLLVKHLVNVQRATVPVGRRSRLENTKAEPAAPFIQHAESTPRGNGSTAR